MNKSNRDLLVLFKEELMSPQAIEHAHTSHSSEVHEVLDGALELHSVLDRYDLTGQLPDMA